MPLVGTDGPNALVGLPPLPSPPPPPTSSNKAPASPAPLRFSQGVSINKCNNNKGAQADQIGLQRGLSPPSPFPGESHCVQALQMIREEAASSPLSVQSRDGIFLLIQAGISWKSHPVVRHGSWWLPPRSGHGALWLPALHGHLLHLWKSPAASIPWDRLSHFFQEFLTKQLSRFFPSRTHSAQDNQEMASGLHLGLYSASLLPDTRPGNLLASENHWWL